MRAPMQFKLFVAGLSKTNEQLQSRLADELKTKFGKEVSLQIIDIISDPEVALQNNVFVTPTLIRQTPLPEKRLIGNLGNSEGVIAAMNGQAVE